ncbi:hypothetical cytosolic protein [Syntrophus aciditrophicus SB]|uniref:Hypothetical cytosolic protein n=1 Tax=Syntrophus aciditrophicus (strain SB) TaxID=56780 RepID=Q2LSF8_SYNAS|nr:hypothetical cytosolic protein [Syntrophus aciditrophicus SB]
MSGGRITGVRLTEVVMINDFHDFDTSRKRSFCYGWLTMASIYKTSDIEEMPNLTSRIIPLKPND